MYRLSPAADLSFFSGALLVQVCVGLNELILNFEPGVSLTILSDFAVADARGASVRHDDAVTGSVAIFALLHDVVSGARATADGGLLLTFASGMTLEIFDDSEQYESFWIRHGAVEIIV